MDKITQIKDQMIALQIEIAGHQEEVYFHKNAAKDKVGILAKLVVELQTLTNGQDQTQVQE